jgi:hypothetical protein
MRVRRAKSTKGYREQIKVVEINHGFVDGDVRC